MSKPVFGIGRRAAPDEFAVARNAPLVIPPDYSLTPPVAGTVSLSAQDAQTQAIEALFGGPAPRSQARLPVPGTSVAAAWLHPLPRRARPNPGERVLDVACRPSFAGARRVAVAAGGLSRTGPAQPAGGWVSMNLGSIVKLLRAGWQVPPWWQ